MNEKSFQIIAALTRRQTGVALDPKSATATDNRLAPVARKFGHKDVDALVANIVATKSRESIRAVIESLMDNETFFYRDGAPFAQSP